MFLSVVQLRHPRRTEVRRKEEAIMRNRLFFVVAFIAPALLLTCPVRLPAQAKVPVGIGDTVPLLGLLRLTGDVIF